LTLKPMFQVAMRQIEEYCCSNNLSIVGYYESPSVPPRPGSGSASIPSPFAEKVGDKLRDNCKEAFIFTNIWTNTPTETKFDISPYIKPESGEKWSLSRNSMKFENDTVFKTVNTLHKRNFFMEIQV
jgi:hypothetical protein